MQISISVSDPADGREETRGPVKVGWLLTETRTGVLFDAPRRVRAPDTTRVHAKSAARCPAVINLESRYFEVACPYDLELQFGRDAEGRPVLRNLAGPRSALKKKALTQILRMTNEAEWRYPDRPIFQLMLPYVFVADEPVYISQLAPFMHYRPQPLPGLTIGGRFPVHVWPRPLMWAFEWVETSKPLVLKRGEPLFYVQFETRPQDRAVQLVEAERTPELDEYMKRISGVTNYVNQTFSLFEAAEKLRPASLVKPVERQ